MIRLNLRRYAWALVGVVAFLGWLGVVEGQDTSTNVIRTLSDAEVRTGDMKFLGLGAPLVKDYPQIKRIGAAYRGPDGMLTLKGWTFDPCEGGLSLPQGTRAYACGVPEEKLIELANTNGANLAWFGARIDRLQKSVDDITLLILIWSVIGGSILGVWIGKFLSTWWARRQS